MRAASNPVSAEDQVQDQNQQQEATDSHAASVPVSAITEAAPKQETVPDATQAIPNWTSDDSVRAVSCNLGPVCQCNCVADNLSKLSLKVSIESRSSCMPTYP